MTIADLFARIGLKTDEDKAKSFDKTMKGVKVGLIAVTGVAAGVSLAIRKITTDAMNGAVALKQFETETGASAQELQKWQSVAEQTNQSAESVSNAIKAITSNQEKIKLGQGDISGYQILGIDPRQDPFKILEDLREKTKGLSEGMKRNILSQMGVGVGLLQTLELTRGEFDAMASKAFIISPQAIDSLGKMKSSVDLASRAIKYIKAQIAVGLAPQVRQLTRDFTNFIKVNEKGIVEGFKQGYKFVKLFLGAVTHTGQAINHLVSNTIGWERAIKGAAIAFGILNASLLFSPIGMITAGIILLIAVLDDILTYSEGGKSLFGNLMEKFPELEKGMFGFIDKIREIKDLFKAFSVGDDMKIDDILDQWGTFGDIIQGLLKALEEIYEFVMPDNYDRAAASAGMGARVKAVGGYEEFVKDPGKFSADISKAILGASGAERALGAPIVNIEQNVYGSGDPEATGTAAARELQRSINSASAQFSRNE